jgi:hypothetical protein
VHAGHVTAGDTQWATQVQRQAGGGTYAAERHVRSAGCCIASGELSGQRANHKLWTNGTRPPSLMSCFRDSSTAWRPWFVPERTRRRIGWPQGMERSSCSARTTFRRGYASSLKGSVRSSVPHGCRQAPTSIRSGSAPRRLSTCIIIGPGRHSPSLPRCSKQSSELLFDRHGPHDGPQGMVSLRVAVRRSVLSIYSERLPTLRNPTTSRNPE